jgi:hypothetical protein
MILGQSGHIPQAPMSSASRSMIEVHSSLTEVSFEACNIADLLRAKAVACAIVPCTLRRPPTLRRPIPSSPVNFEL